MAMVQVGSMALRDADGNFLPSVPLYADFPDEDIQPSGFTKREEKNLQDITEVFFLKFKQYMDGCKALGMDMEKYLIDDTDDMDNDEYLIDD